MSIFVRWVGRGRGRAHTPISAHCVCLPSWWCAFCVPTQTARCSDIQKCGIVCLDHDAFQFPGAAAVTTAYIQNNPFAALPEKLLWNMTKLIFLYARDLTELTTLPERFFLNKGNLLLLFMTSSTIRTTPDGLFKGLFSLKYFSWLYISFSNLPNLDDLNSMSFFLVSGAIGKEPPTWNLNAQESESVFDGLATCETVWAGDQALTLVPSIKKMKGLEELNLARNKITKIWPSDFAGAVNLVVLRLDGNGITSIAAEAFTNLVRHRVKHEDFHPLKADGVTPYCTFDLCIGAFRVRSAGGQEGVRDRHRLLRPCCFPRATADWEVRHKQTLLGFARVIQT